MSNTPDQGRMMTRWTVFRNDKRLGEFIAEKLILRDGCLLALRGGRSLGCCASGKGLRWEETGGYSMTEVYRKDTPDLDKAKADLLEKIPQAAKGYVNWLFLETIALWGIRQRAEEAERAAGEDHDYHMQRAAELRRQSGGMTE